MRRKSQVAKQIGHRNLERLGNFYNRINRRRLFAALNFADVVVMQVSLLSQSFLTQADFLPADTNGLPENFAVFSFRCHGLKRKQEPEKATTV